MIVSTLSSVMVRRCYPEYVVKSLDCCVQGQDHSDGSKLAIFKFKVKVTVQADITKTLFLLGVWKS